MFTPIIFTEKGRWYMNLSGSAKIPSSHGHPKRMASGAVNQFIQTLPIDIRFTAGKGIQLERAKDEMIKLIEAAPALP